MKSPWIYRLAVITVFVLGVVSGAAGMYIYKKKQDQRLYQMPDTLARVVAQRLGEDLELSAAQEENVIQAINAARTDFLAVMRDSMPRLLVVASTCLQRIRDSLNETQRREFDRLLEKRRQHLQKLMGDQTPIPVPFP